MIKIVLFGTGNVATHLFNAFQSCSDIEVVQLFSRSNTTQHSLFNDVPIITTFKEVQQADIYILAIPDDAISEVSNNIPDTDVLVVHTSGSVPLDALKGNYNKGVFYPLQTFSKNTNLVFKSVPICIEADNSESLSLLKNLAYKLSENVFEITSHQRENVHLAAVFVNNFTNYMYTIGQEIAAKNNFDFSILQPLIQETAKKITKTSPTNAQTGPARRNDLKTIEKHVHLLDNTNYKELYISLTNAIKEHYGKKL